MSGSDRSAPRGNAVSRTAALTLGPAGETWCTTCKAYTRLVGTVLALHLTGVQAVGTYSFCEVCDDPDDPEAPRG